MCASRSLPSYQLGVAAAVEEVTVVRRDLIFTRKPSFLSGSCYSSVIIRQIKDYVVISVLIAAIQYLCSDCLINSHLIKFFDNIEERHRHHPQTQQNPTKMNERLNIGHEARELKLGSTFSPQNSQTAFHTIKYDFKPASVDLNKVATLDVGSNNQVTVTVPNIESSGVPHTVFKGNQRKYTKECIIIFDKKTGVMTLEKLNHNIQVKKTRSENTSKNVAPPHPPPHKLENNTQRTSSKTRVSTGFRKNAIIGFVPRNSPMQGSPSVSHSTNHKSPQSAPAWNANNAQSTLPSIPLIEVEDVNMPSSSSSGVGSMITHNNTNLSASTNNKNSDYHQSQTSTQYQNNSHHHSSNSSGTKHHSSSIRLERTAAVEQEIGVLSSSDSSSDSDSSGSGSDSDDSGEGNNVSSSIKQTNSQKKHSSNHQQQPYTNGTFPALLHDDLQLSESNSSSSDSDDD